MKAENTGQGRKKDSYESSSKIAYYALIGMGVLMVILFLIQFFNYISTLVQ